MGDGGMGVVVVVVVVRGGEEKNGTHAPEEG